MAIPIALGALVAVFFGDLFLPPGDRVLSRAGTDVWRQFAGWRQFGFDAWRSGDFPLWNPFVYGGLPYLSGFQSALFYPPNWLFLACPLPFAINGTIALHVWWLSVGVFLWVRRTDLHPAAAAFAALVVVFGGPHFLHVHAGHLSNLCVMAWVPWLLLAVDEWQRTGRPLWVAAGAVVFAMETFAGHPQYVYYTGLVVALSAGASFLRAGAVRRTKFLPGVAAMLAGGLLLAAAQAWPGLAALAESGRGAGTPTAFSGTYSFPPENFLTSIVPRLFGDVVRAEYSLPEIFGGTAQPAYWGRWLYWEMCAFVGVTGFVSMGLGALRGRDRGGARADFGLATSLIVLALGMYTPLFSLMLHVPGYAMFRGSAKLLFFATLFAARLAARGIDALLRGGHEAAARVGSIGAGALAVLLVPLGLALVTGAESGGPGWWTDWRKRLWETAQVTHLPAATYFDPVFVAQATRNAAHGMLLAGGLALIVAGLLHVARKHRFAVWVSLIVGSGELLCFASRFRETFSLSDLAPAEAVAYRRANPGDFRVLDRSRVNGGLLSGLPDVWGDDPGVLRRWAEFVAATQGRSPADASQWFPLDGPRPRWDLLRFRATLAPTDGGGVEIRESAVPPLRRFELVPEWEVCTERDSVLARVLDPTFDPRHTVVLEAPPSGLAERGAPSAGTWEILDEGVDRVDVHVAAPAGGILLMTDPFCRGWSAETLGSTPVQARYDLQPADWALRAIPLAPGEHDLRISYHPLGLGAGSVVSATSWVLLILLLRRASKAPRLANRGEA